MKRVLSDMYFLGRKCIFCDKYGLYRLKNNRLKCKHCKKYYSLRKLRDELINDLDNIKEKYLNSD